MKKKYNRREFLGMTTLGLSALASSNKPGSISLEKPGRISYQDKTGSNNQILNIYDGMAKDGIEAIPDWGFSVFIQYNGKTILFDAGTHPDVLEHNAKVLGVDLTTFDIALLSHNHADHLPGFDHLLKVNQDFKLYLPNDADLGADRLRSDKKYKRGFKYRHANTEFISKHTEIAPGAFLIATTSTLLGHYSKYPPNDNEPKFTGMPELSLALEGEDGSFSVISGCSHSTIEEIVKAAKSHLNKEVSFVCGGFHHGPYSNEHISNISTMMKNELGVKRVAPTHCTGTKSINIFKDLYKEDYHYFGLGTKITL